MSTRLLRALRLGTAASLAIGAALSMDVAPAHAAAGPFDGTVPLLCAFTGVVECGATGECQRRTPDDVNLPSFISIDFKGQTLNAADGSTRTAPIQRFERADGRVILQGGQEGRAWSAVIVGDSGKLTAGVTDAQGAFLVFGACTTR